tara:strand:- start:794 stop:2932 length:2139 start_codon:yes stop_codon:yes gene_type:complete
MLQLTQKLGSGAMMIQNVPNPQIDKGMILVKNHFSIISSGTEGSTVSTARKSLLGKAKERPQQAKQVLDTLIKQGPIQTYRAVTKRLDSYSPLGYSCAGEVIDIGENVNEFKIGDKVACAGVGYANHAEIVSVPVNLCVKLPKDANLKNAAYNTLGSIAMQGVRQADMRLGEICAVIGLGLIGQLTSMILKASGVTVVGIDINEMCVNIALENNAVDFGILRNKNDIDAQIKHITGGYGVDSVIISAGTDSLDPINFAGEISRKKGKVIILGDVPTGFERNPFWYKKELELKMACSYGPGRYDLNYEEKGIDYPLPYVRWTQKRNMQAFQNLISSNKIKIDYLTTHKFQFERAKDAFEMIIQKSDFFIGICLEYNFKKKNYDKKIKIFNNDKLGIINLSFLGAGSYAQSNLLTNIPSSNDIVKVGILTNSGTTSKRVAEKFKFKFCTTKEEDVFDKNTNTIFIATRHDSHASYVIKGLKSNKNIFVEKPLCLKESELDEITKLKLKSKTSLMIGFNRRFSSLTIKLKKFIGSSPMTMVYRINAGEIPFDNWIQDLEIGGGRVLGEVCHFIDLMTFVNGSLPIKVSASALPNTNGINDTINILIQFENGSSGVIAFYSNGSRVLTKEYIEVFSLGKTAIIDDFKQLILYSKGKPKKTKYFNQDKGQKLMLNSFLQGIIKTGRSPISFNEIVAVTKACFKVLDSIKSGGKQIEI